MKLSVIIPALNEEKSIGQLVAYLLRHGSEAVSEVIVVDGGSSDQTKTVAAAAGALVIESAVQSRAAQMNAGARAAKSSILYFIHADTRPPESFVSDIQEALHQGYCSGCYRYVFDSPSRMLRINAWFTRFDRLMFRGGDQTLFIEKSVFQNLNGFDERFVIMEEYDFLIRLRQNHRFKIIQKDMVVSARKYETNSWLRVQVANLVAMVMFRTNADPVRIKQTYKRLLNYR